MGQIALQEEDLEGALSLFDQAVADAGAETWIIAWSCVQKGKIYAIQGDDEKAKAEWNKVLTLRGDLHGAAEAARKALGREP
jgi:predicted TPR repeat methyltransferase